MSNFSPTYRPPGVYTFEETAPIVAAPSTIAASTVTILGPSVGFQRHMEAVTLNGVDPVRLSRRGVDQSSVEVTLTDQTHVPPGDYVLTTDPGEDQQGGTPDDITSIERSENSDISDGAVVIVTYRYTDSSYFTPRLFSDYNAVRDVYGQPISPETGEIVSPLSLAAKFAFDNGASRLLLLPVAGTAEATTAEHLSDGYSKLLNIVEASLIVPLPVGLDGSEGSPGDTLTVGANLAAHMASAESNGTRRVGILGYETGVTVDPRTLASNINSSRVMLAWPNRMLYHNATLSQTTTIAGYYLAAAFAGRMASLPVNTPITRKGIAGFSGIPSDLMEEMTKTRKDDWSRSGVAVAEIATQRGLVVRHAVSTQPGTVISREMSITRARDVMIGSVVTTLDGADLIGSPIVEETPARIKGVVQGVLESMVESDTIIAYQGLSVRQTSSDPSVIEVRFQYRPTYPLNYINIVFGVDPTSGLVTDTLEEFV